MSKSNAFKSPDEAGMLGSNANDNDICYRLDSSQWFVLMQRPANILANWEEIAGGAAALSAANDAREMAINAGNTAQQAIGDAYNAQETANAALIAANNAGGGLTASETMQLNQASSAAINALALAQSVSTKTADYLTVSSAYLGVQTITAGGVNNILKSTASDIKYSGNYIGNVIVILDGSAGSNEYAYKIETVGRYEFEWIINSLRVTSSDTNLKVYELFIVDESNNVLGLSAGNFVPFIGQNNISIQVKCFADLTANKVVKAIFRLAAFNTGITSAELNKTFSIVKKIG